MRFRSWLAFLLVSVVTTLSPLAHSDLPDQLWLPGFFDGGDEDDALNAIQLYLTGIQPLIVEAVSSIESVPFASQRCERLAPILAVHRTHSRAPPIL